MNGLPPEVQQMILNLKAKRGELETETRTLSEEINRLSGRKGSNQDRINQLGQAIFVLEREGNGLPVNAQQPYPQNEP